MQVKAFRHGSDSSSTAEMFRGSFSTLSVLKFIMSYILQPDWPLLLLVNIQGSLHCKQGKVIESIILQLPVV